MPKEFQKGLTDKEKGELLTILEEQGKINWIIFLFSEIWKEKFVKMKDTLMIVDGHVGKVFCRTGLLTVHC